MLGFAGNMCVGEFCRVDKRRMVLLIFFFFIFIAESSKQSFIEFFASVNCSDDKLNAFFQLIE